MTDHRKILVTSALPYANGSIHLGHLVEYIQTDIWVRQQKMMGHECHYMCADDTHGTPIMISARNQGITPEALIEAVHAEHYRDFQDFLVEFDNYYTTNSPENKLLAEMVYLAVKEKGHIAQRDIEQMYCPEDAMFLPDRMIRGKCPKCGAEDQYGDACEICSATYDPTDLVEAHCSLCGTAPETRTSTHYFFKLGDFQEQLESWIDGDHVQPEVRSKIKEWFEGGLKDWDISRDAPYFGFKIPGTDDKYFYVWLDAPIGYMASTMNWCERTGRNFDDFWRSDDCEIVHFIGKDILYFHTLFWPAMLMGADLQTPDKVYVHGFLTVNGKKMSKSRGTFISAREYLEHLNPEALRYYYACKLNARVEDIDLNLFDFVTRVNSDVANQFINLGSRTMSFLSKRLDGRLGPMDEAGIELMEALEDGAREIAGFYDQREYSKAMRRLIELAHAANQFVANQAPWAAIKEDPEKARAICTAGVNAFGKLAVLLTPVMPQLAAKVQALLNREVTSFEAVFERLEEGTVKPFEPIFEKLEEEAVMGMVEASTKRSEETPEEEAYEVDDLTETVSYDDFVKVDLRVAEILEAEGVPKANKLLKIKVSLGPLGTRTIFAGIKKSHDPAKLIGRKIVVAANLAPRQMKFGLSEGMLLAAGPGGEDVFLLGVEEKAKPGMRVN